MKRACPGRVATSTTVVLNEQASVIPNCASRPEVMFFHSVTPPGWEFGASDDAHGNTGA